MSRWQCQAFQKMGVWWSWMSFQLGDSTEEFHKWKTCRFDNMYKYISNILFSLGHNCQSWSCSHSSLNIITKRSSAAANREAGTGSSKFSLASSALPVEINFPCLKILKVWLVWGVTDYCSRNLWRMPVWKASHSKVKQKNMLISMSESPFTEVNIPASDCLIIAFTFYV